jgi:putative transposase
VRRALRSLFGSAVSENVVSGVLCKSDWDAWNAHSLADESIVRLIADGTVVRVQLDRKATSISRLLCAACAPMAKSCRLRSRAWGGESAEACVNCCHAVLGIACLRSNQHEQG